jgi:3-hydroxybutyryl-CoA dehydratase
MNKRSEISQYRLEDIEPGFTQNFSVRVTKAMINEYAKLTGDFSPIHMDEEYARTTKFGQRICHGMLLSSFFSRLIGMHLPGKNGLLLSYSLRHLLPCYVNQVIVVEGTVLDKSPATRVITLKAVVRDSLGKVLVDGVLKVIVRE